MTIEEILKQHFPKEMKEFAASPWNYKVIPSIGLDEEAIFYVHLEIGKHMKVADMTFEISIVDVFGGQVKVRRTHIKCPKFTS